MLRWNSVPCLVAVLAVGYVAGLAGLPFQGRLTAQESKSAPNLKVSSALMALNEAAISLTSEGKYESITQGPNAFLILSGGGNAREDLESGNGVDPETYAALYAGKAIPELKDQLKFDDTGRLTYNGQIVRMYSKSRLERAYATRAASSDAP